MLTGCSQRWSELDTESNQRGRRGGTWLQALDPIRKKIDRSLYQVISNWTMWHKM